MRSRVGIVLAMVMFSGALGGCASSLQNAAERGDLQVVKTLMDQGAGAKKEDVADAFVNAAGAGHLQVVQLFLEKGVEIETRGNCQHPWYKQIGTPSTITFHDVTALMCAAGHGQARAVQFFLDYGADVNAKQIGGKWTALYSAAYLGHSQVAKQLLDRGAEDISGPLRAVRESERHPEIVRLLEQAEARQLGTAPSIVSSPGPALPAPPAIASLPASDVDTLPAVRSKAKSNAYAVVIGIEQYREKLPRADFADRDAKLIGEYLTKVMGYPEQNVVVRLNERANRTDLVKYFEEWLRNNVEAGGSVFVYYSGHGAPNPKTGDAYLVPYDGDPAFVDSTAYPLKQLYAALGKLPAKDVTVVLDSCFSGAGGRSVLAEGARPMIISVENPVLAGNKTVVLAASSGTQISSTFKEQGHGLLTYYFLKGLQGAADGNKDGSISLAEVFDYVKPNVQKVARKQYNNEQTPQLLGSQDLLKKGIRLIEPAP